MKTSRIISIVFIISLIIWFVHAAVESIFFPEKSYLEWLITSVSVADLIFRLFLVLMVGATAVLMYGLWLSGRNPTGVDIYVRDEILKTHEKDSEAFREFFYTLKTQLNNIIGFTNLLNEENLDDKTANTYIGYLESSKEALVAAIDQLISRYKGGDYVPAHGSMNYVEEIDWSAKTILVVEDMEINYKLLQVILDKTKATVLWAKNGREAVDLVVKHPEIDIVLMDIIMPEMDGIEATKEIRKFKPDLPIIAQSAYSFEHDDRALKETGFNGFITKPIWHYDLIQKCSAYFTGIETSGAGLTGLGKG